MADFDKNRIAKMQQYLAEITDPNFQGSATDKRMAVAELFNYYHSDWQQDALHFVDKNLEITERYKVQGIPVIIITDGEKELSRKAGEKSYNELYSWIEDLINKNVK